MGQYAARQSRLIRRPKTVTESTLADIFAFRLKAKAVFRFDDKHWYLWDGEKWQTDKQKQMLQHIVEFVQYIESPISIFKRNFSAPDVKTGQNR